MKLGGRRGGPHAEFRMEPNMVPVSVGRPPGMAVRSGDLGFIRCSLTLRMSDEQRPLEWPRLL